MTFCLFALSLTLSPHWPASRFSIEELRAPVRRRSMSESIHIMSATSARPQQQQQHPTKDWSPTPLQVANSSSGSVVGLNGSGGRSVTPQMARPLIHSNITAISQSDLPSNSGPPRQPLPLELLSRRAGSSDRMPNTAAAVDSVQSSSINAITKSSTDSVTALREATAPVAVKIHRPCGSPKLAVSTIKCQESFTVEVLSVSFLMR